MAKYVLSANEYIILKKENVSFPNSSDNISELLLTNENIVVSTSGVFYSKNRMLPVRQIKRFKDRAQIVLTNIRNEKAESLCQILPLCTTHLCVLSMYS